MAVRADGKVNKHKHAVVVTIICPVTVNMTCAATSLNMKALASK